MSTCLPPPIAALPLPQNAWWHQLHTDPNAVVRLWLFPCLGSGAAIWHPWIKPLAGAAEIVSVCLPGREARLNQAPVPRMDSLAGAIADQMYPYVDDRDVFCGAGMGALLAFEVASRLRGRRSIGPRGLVVCGIRAPHHAPEAEILHRMSAIDFVAAVERRYGAMPNEFRDRPEVLELLLPALRADLEADETYVRHSSVPLDIPILALAGNQDRIVSRSAMWGWCAHTRAHFELDQVPGGHFFATQNSVATADRVRTFLSKF
jgi:medium-chain acyl-[acyl-carrier-protein] hydrolase